MPIAQNDILNHLASQDLRNHSQHFRHVTVRFPEKDNVPFRFQDHQDRDGHRQTGGFIAPPVRLQGIIPFPVDHLPDPLPMKRRQVLKPDPTSQIIRFLQYMKDYFLDFVILLQTHSPFFDR